MLAAWPEMLRGDQATHLREIAPAVQVLFAFLEISLRVS
jgi:hypothetical protein